MTPADVVRRWFDAHAKGDLALARSLLAPEAVVHTAETQLAGFDAFVAWYEARRATDQTFTYEVIDMLGGAQHAAAVITLRSATGEWGQVALYRVDGGVITEIHLFEW